MTWEGSRAPVVQAEPAEAATPCMSSPSSVPLPLDAGDGDVEGLFGRRRSGSAGPLRLGVGDGVRGSRQQSWSRRRGAWGLRASSSA